MFAFDPRLSSGLGFEDEQVPLLSLSLLILQMGFTVDWLTSRRGRSRRMGFAARGPES